MGFFKLGKTIGSSAGISDIMFTSYFTFRAENSVILVRNDSCFLVGSCPGSQMHKAEPRAANLLLEEMVSSASRVIGSVYVSLHTLNNQCQSMAIYSRKSAVSNDSRVKCIWLHPWWWKDRLVRCILSFTHGKRWANLQNHHYLRKSTTLQRADTPWSTQGFSLILIEVKG